jgi:hypothetical protein
MGVTVGRRWTSGGWWWARQQACASGGGDDAGGTDLEGCWHGWGARADSGQAAGECVSLRRAGLAGAEEYKKSPCAGTGAGTQLGTQRAGLSYGAGRQAAGADDDEGNGSSGRGNRRRRASPCILDVLCGQRIARAHDERGEREISEVPLDTRAKTARSRLLVPPWPREPLLEK